MDESGGLGCSALIDVQPRGLGPFVLVDGSFRLLLADRRKPKSQELSRVDWSGRVTVSMPVGCKNAAQDATGEKLAKTRW